MEQMHSSYIDFQKNLRGQMLNVIMTLIVLGQDRDYVLSSADFYKSIPADRKTIKKALLDATNGYTSRSGKHIETGWLSMQPHGRQHLWSFSDKGRELPIVKSLVADSLKQSSLLDTTTISADYEISPAGKIPAQQEKFPLLQEGDGENSRNYANQRENFPQLCESTGNFPANDDLDARLTAIERQNAQIMDALKELAGRIPVTMRTDGRSSRNYANQQEIFPQDEPMEEIPDANPDGKNSRNYANQREKFPQLREPTGEIPAAESEGKNSRSADEIPASVADAWQTALSELALQLGQPMFNNLLLDATVTAVTSGDGGEIWTISVPETGKSWLETRFYDTVKRTVAGIYANGNFSLKFVVDSTPKIEYSRTGARALASLEATDLANSSLEATSLEASHQDTMRACRLSPKQITEILKARPAIVDVPTAYITARWHQLQRQAANNPKLTATPALLAYRLKNRAFQPIHKSCNDCGKCDTCWLAWSAED